MKRLFYLQNGTAVTILPEGYNLFYVSERVDATSSLSRYSFPGDSIQYDLDNLCVDLYDTFRDRVFNSPNEYYKDFGLQPQWIMRAGLDSDFDMPKEQLEECFSTPIHERMLKHGIHDKNLLAKYQEIESQKFKYAYVADCQGMVNTLQELLRGCHSAFIGFYKQLCTLPNEADMDGVYYAMGPDSRMAYSFLYSFIIQTYSSFDVLTKIAYELENIRTCEEAYAKLASSKMLYGDKKRLHMDVTGTIFEKCRAISIIENLRNELVHNSTWEMNPKIFITTNDGVVVERHIFFPDFTEEGTIVTYKNRKRFFSSGNKVNTELPRLYFDVFQRICMTLIKILAKRPFY